MRSQAIRRARQQARAAIAIRQGCASLSGWPWKILLGAGRCTPNLLVPSDGVVTDCHDCGNADLTCVNPKAPIAALKLLVATAQCLRD
jgi:hypothetical protein